MLKIKLNNMQFYGYHGVLPEEKKLGRFFRSMWLYTYLKNVLRTIIWKIR